MAGCPGATPVRCGLSCVDITSDANHCGGCGTGCASRIPNAQSFCSGGRCQLGECNPGFVKQDGACVACTPRKADGVRALAAPGSCARWPTAPARSGLRATGRRATGRAGWGSDAPYWETFTYPDLNGDGRGDVCSRSSDGFYCGLSNGSRFDPSSSLWDEAFSNWNGWHLDRSYWGTLQHPDVNGDGKADACGRSGWGIYCGLAGPNSFGRVYQWTWEFLDAGGWKDGGPAYWAIEFPDVDGDGRADVCGRAVVGLVCARSNGSNFGDHVDVWSAALGNEGGWHTSPDRWATIQYPDLNMDGKADVCARSPAGIVCGLSNGQAFSELVVWADAFKTAVWERADTYSTIQFPDLNGDGKQDVCGRGPDGIACGLNTGSAFGPVSIWQADFTDAAGWNVQARAGTIQFTDLDGDGNADVCGRSASGIVCAISNGTSRFGDAKLWSNAFADPHWSAPEYWTTIGFPVAEPGNCRRYPKPSSFIRPAARLPF